ncbi:peroxidase-like protein [Mercenaria mercenaria]|uniref:peroxidase-like protein n=1 Tax=Mercenaria mercenaria TaxID=6596 RepID=UPI00234EE622|nr:peroxidase-like protein [Mercenaria mercenaria]
MEIKELLRFVSLIAIVHLSNTILTRKPGDVRNILFTTPLTTNRVEELLQRAREVSFRQRRQYNETRKTNGRMTSRCLFSLHHGTYRSGHTKDYTKATDMLRTMRSLMFEDGYSPEYLQTKAAMWTFERVQGFECDLPNPGFCDFTSRYRTPDGSCNNIVNPRWGMAGMIQRRIVKSAYDDTFGLPRRRGVNNVALPEPRHISNAVHFNPGSDKKLSYENKLYFAKSQFTNHDVYMTPKSKIDDCCEHGDGWGWAGDGLGRRNIDIAI